MHEIDLLSQGLPSNYTDKNLSVIRKTNPLQLRTLPLRSLIKKTTTRESERVRERQRTETALYDGNLPNTQFKGRDIYANYNNQYIKNY